MSLKEAYAYIDQENIQASDLETSMALAYMMAYDAPITISFNLENIIEEVKEDIAIYGENEKAWVYLGKYDGMYIPDDYLLENHDLLDEECLHIECTLHQALRIFELINDLN